MDGRTRNQTERKTSIHLYRQTDKDTDGQSYIQTGTETDEQSYIQTATETDGQSHIHTDKKETNRETDKPQRNTYERHMDRHAMLQTEIHSKV